MGLSVIMLGYTMINKPDSFYDMLKLHSSDYLVVAWLIIPIFFMYIVSQMSFSIWLNRFLLISLPAAYLLLARSLTTLPFSRKIIIILSGMIVSFQLYLLVFQSHYYDNTYSRGHLSKCAEYVISHETQLSSAIVMGYFWDESYFRYYFKKNNYPITVLKASGAEQCGQTLSQYNPSSVWIMACCVMPDQNIMEFLNNNMILSEQHKYPDKDHSSKLYDQCYDQCYDTSVLWHFKRKI